MVIPCYVRKRLLGHSRWISLDPHIHSIYSGGDLSPSKIVNGANLTMLDAVAISDHNEVRGAIEAQIISQTTSDFPVVLTGQEISAGDRVHLLLLGDAEAQADPGRRNMENVLMGHRLRGGAVILAHPWTAWKTSWGQGRIHEWLTEGLIDGIELGNASALQTARPERKILEQIWDEWIVPFRLGVLGGSDYHCQHRGCPIGSGRSYVKVDRPDAVGIIEALRRHQSIAGLFGFDTAPGFPGFGLGENLFWGLEPWSGQITRLWDTLQYALTRCNLPPTTIVFLRRAMSAGHFQIVADLLL